MAKVRADLRWEDRAKEFSSLNAREAETNTLLTEVTQVSNMSFEELGALKKINGNEEVSNYDFSDIALTNKTVEYTYSTAGVYTLNLEASASNVVIQEYIVVGGGGGGGGGRDGFKSGDFGRGGGGGGAGFRSTSTNVSVGVANTFTITVGSGGTGGAGTAYQANIPGTDGTASSIAYLATTITGNGGGGGTSLGGAGQASGADGGLPKAGDGGTGIAPQNGTAGTNGSLAAYVSNGFGLGGLYAGGGGGGSGGWDKGYNGGAGGNGGRGYVYIRINYDY